MNIFGVHAVSAALQKQPENCLELLLQTGQRSSEVSRICDSAAAAGIRVTRADRRVLNDHCYTADHPIGNHQGVVLKIKVVQQYRESDLDALLHACDRVPLVLALDNVQDPHNLGACLRSAEILGVDLVIAPKHRACDITPVVRKVACGAAERVPFIRVSNLARTLAILQRAGLWVSGAAGEADAPISDIDFTRATVLVMGSEGRGLRNRTRKACDYLISIPMCSAVGSFNVSVACGICLYEVARQRAAAEVEYKFHIG